MAPALSRGSSLLRTGRTRSFGDEQYLALLLAGSLLQVALILVGVTVGATDGHVVIVALQGHRTAALAVQRDGAARGYVPPTPQHETTRRTVGGRHCLCPLLEKGDV